MKDDEANSGRCFICGEQAVGKVHWEIEKWLPVCEECFEDIE